MVAIAHTHGAFSNGEFDDEFISDEPDSVDDDIGAAKHFELNIYVATPGGLIKRYNYKTGDIYTFAYKTFHDYRTRFNFWKIRHKCSKCAN